MTQSGGPLLRSPCTRRRPQRVMRTAPARSPMARKSIGSEIEASNLEQEPLMLDIAAARLSRNELVAWLREHVRSLP